MNRMKKMAISDMVFGFLWIAFSCYVFLFGKSDVRAVGAVFGASIGISEIIGGYLYYHYPPLLEG